MKAYDARHFLDEVIKDVSQLSLERIQDGSGSAHGPKGREGWITGLSMTRLYGPGYHNLIHNSPGIYKLISELEFVIDASIYQVMVNQLAPGKRLRPHTDAEGNWVRYHYPVITNEAVEYWDELNGAHIFESGIWYGPIPYSSEHCVSNRSDLRRVTIVADFIPLPEATI